MLVTLALAAAFAIFVGAQDLSGQEPHFPPESDCNTTDGVNHVYRSCQFTCGDMANSLDGKQPCYLSSHGEMETVPIVKSRDDAGIGECVNGKCVKEPAVAQEPQAVP
uniref:Putative secreted protein n=1 Tax=Amblyomma parvum TaxID=251391 RepID=A0A023G284_AMBPA